MESNFLNDLTNEALLGKFLDDIYSQYLIDFQVERISDLNQQQKGIDLIISKGTDKYYIDEKAQLDYINKDLPTSAFEISYLKNGVEKKGWLYDDSKLTHKYFIITGIFLNNPANIHEGFQKCKITSVNRAKLKELLETKGLNWDRINEINNQIREGAEINQIPIKELDEKTEGRFYFSKSNKSEQPINIVLYLDFLIKSKVAKRIL